MAQKKKTVKKSETGMLKLTGINELPVKAELEKWPIFGYRYCYTTGPFLLPENSGSLDWAVLNNDSTVQKVRVTVYKCPVGMVKTPVAPGAIVVSINPGVTTHNANEYTEGFAYEIQIECNSQLIFPYVSVWPGHNGVVIPGADINSGLFLRLLP